MSLTIRDGKIIIEPSHVHYNTIKEKWAYWPNAHYGSNMPFKMFIQSDDIMVIIPVNVVEPLSNNFLSNYWDTVIFPKIKEQMNPCGEIPLSDPIKTNIPMPDAVYLKADEVSIIRYSNRNDEPIDLSFNAFDFKSVEILEKLNIKLTFRSRIPIIIKCDTWAVAQAVILKIGKIVGGRNG